MNKNNYPMQFYKVGRKNLVMGCEFSVFPFTNQENLLNNPLGLCEKYSTLKFNFSDNTRKTGGDGHIRLDEVDGIIKNTEYAYDKIMNTNYLVEDNNSADIPQDVNVPIKFLSGKMSSDKGQMAMALAQKYIPQDILLSTNALLQAAKKVNKFTQNNVNQFIGLSMAAIIVHKTEKWKTNFSNIVQGQAVNVVFSEEEQALTQIAVNLGNMNVDKLKIAIALEYEKENKQATTNIIPVYEAFKTPNAKKLDNEGMTKAYELKIICNTTDNYPFSIHLTTMRGVPLQDRTVGINRRTAKDIKEFNIKLSKEQWIHILQEFTRLRNAYTNAMFANCYQTALSINNSNFANSRNNK